MLRVFEKRGASGQLKEVHIDDISSMGNVWIDAFNPTQEELETISKKTHIPVVELSEYVDPDERPHVHDTDLFSRIVFSYPLAEKVIKVAPVFIFMFGRQGILTLHKKDIAPMDRMIKYLADHPETINSSSSLLHYLLDTLVSEFFYFLDSIGENTDKIEESIIKSDAKLSKLSIQQIFNIKRTLILFHKALIADRDVISAIEKGYLKRMTKKETEGFRDVYNDLVQLIDTGDTNREILTGVLETYLTTLSNNMNDIMKKLTAYASLVLVPTLISGIYGMNFDHMPELHWIFGYPFSLLLMVVSAVLLYIFFRRKQWI